MKEPCKLCVYKKVCAERDLFGICREYKTTIDEKVLPVLWQYRHFDCKREKKHEKTSISAHAHV